MNHLLSKLWTPSLFGPGPCTCSHAPHLSAKLWQFRHCRRNVCQRMHPKCSDPSLCLRSAPLCLSGTWPQLPLEPSRRGAGSLCSLTSYTSQACWTLCNGAKLPTMQQPLPDEMAFSSHRHAYTHKQQPVTRTRGMSYSSMTATLHGRSLQQVHSAVIVVREPSTGRAWKLS